MQSADLSFQSIKNTLSKKTKSETKNQQTIPSYSARSVEIMETDYQRGLYQQEHEPSPVVRPKFESNSSERIIYRYEEMVNGLCWRRALISERILSMIFITITKLKWYSTSRKEELC